MSFLYNNVAAITVAAVVSLMAWLWGGVRGDLLVRTVPWLFVVMLEVLVCYPQRHRGETTYEARARLWHALKHSPVFWVSVGLLALLAVPFVNNGLCRTCDAALLAQGVKAEPPVPGLPFCVNRADHLDVFLWFVVALLSLVIVHHSLTKRGKRLVLELIVWNGAALAMFGFVQGASGAPGPFWTPLPDGRPDPDFFATFGYPNQAGSYFTALFGLSVALWRDQCERKRLEESALDSSSRSAAMGKNYGRFWRQHYFLMPAAVFFFAAINTLSRAAIVLVTSLAVIYFAHTLVVLLSRMNKSRRVFVGVWSLVVFGLLVFFVSISLPKTIRKEVNSLETTAMLDRVTGRGQYHADVATSLWRDHKLFGCGGWGYKHFCRAKMEELKIDQRKIQMVGGINVHNDYLQFLAEHGVVGFGALVALVVLLVRPVVRQWRGMLQDLRFKKGKELPPKPMAIFVLPAPAFFILVSCLATLIHAFGDCPLRSAATLPLLLVSLAAIPGFMPTGETETHRHHHRR